MKKVVGVIRGVEEDTFNLEVEEYPFFFAEGVWVHNCRKQFTSYDYVTQILGREPVGYLMERFTQVQLDVATRTMSFGEFHRKPLDIREAQDLFKKEKDLGRYLKSLYKAPNGKT